MSEHFTTSERRLPSATPSCGLAWLVVVVGIAGCSSLLGAEIRFALPAGFRGGFIIVEDSDGKDVRKSSGVVVVDVPPTRVVKVKSFAPFRPFHTESFQFGKDGPLRKVDLTPEDQKVELRGMGSGTGGTAKVTYRERIWYVFGTADETEAFDPFSLFRES
jgi:hypothetical protein